MPISYTHKIIFIHVPKCAGTSIETILQTGKEENFFTTGLPSSSITLLPQEKFTDREYRLCASKNRQHYTYRELAKILPQNVLNSFKKISVVRNPYDRLVSDYHFYDGALKCHKDFEEFVKNVLNLEEYKRVWLYDGHLETQTSFLINEQGNFNSIDKIFKFENLDECFEYLSTITGKLEKVRARVTTNRKPWEEYYTPELKELVYNFYKEDFINFNY